MSEVGLICPICNKTHFKNGMQWLGADGTKRVVVRGDPYCSDECRKLAEDLEAEG